MAFLDIFTGNGGNMQNAGKEATQKIIPYSQQVLQWFALIGFTLVGIGIAWFIVWWISFRIPTILGEIIGANNEFREIKKTRSKIIKKEGIEKLKIFMIKGFVKPPDQNEYSMKNGKKILYLIKSGGSWIPYRIIGSQIGSIAVNDADIRHWASMEMKHTAKKYTEQTFMQKYGAVVMFIFGLIVLGWMYWVFAKMFQANLANQLNAQAQISDKFGEIAKILGEKIKGP